MLPSLKRFVPSHHQHVFMYINLLAGGQGRGDNEERKGRWVNRVHHTHVANWNLTYSRSHQKPHQQPVYY